MPKWLIILAFAAILGVPFLMKSADPSGSKHAQARVIIITPHVRQISQEFGLAFERWHKRVYAEEIEVDWRGPLGTSEIIKLLQAQYVAAIKRGDIGPDGSCPAGTVGFDIMFGGGSYDHGRLKDPKNAQAEIIVDGKPVVVQVSMSTPAGFDPVWLKSQYEDPPTAEGGKPLTPEQLAEWAKKPATVGAEDLYDAQQYWCGNALSSFGILHNVRMFAKLGLPTPTGWEDLTSPLLTGEVALADPRQSGSLATALEMILNSYPWHAAQQQGWAGAIAKRGWSADAIKQHPEAMDEAWRRAWRTLRDLTANARYYASSSTKPPIDVAQGEAAAALAIDFYGKSQAASVNRPGDTRVLYADPLGATSFDPDPVSILRGGPNFKYAKRFAEFCLTEEAQALWQFPAGDGTTALATNPPGPGGPMGPISYALHRLPVKKSMYARYLPVFTDPVEPFKIAPSAKPVGWRDGLLVMLPAFGIDTAEDQVAAWKALNRARRMLGTSFSPDPETVRTMEELFYSFPRTDMPDGAQLEFTPANYPAIAVAWKDGAFKRTCKLAYSAYFRATYAEVVRLGRSIDGP